MDRPPNTWRSVSSVAHFLSQAVGMVTHPERRPILAFLPCAFGPHRFSGPSSTFYPAIVDRVESIRWKIRTCPEHARILLDALKDDEVLEDTPLNNENPTCPSCLNLVRVREERPKNLYLTSYVKGQERRDFWSVLHANCGAPAWLPYTGEDKPS